MNGFVFQEVFVFLRKKYKTFFFDEGYKIYGTVLLIPTKVN